MILEFKEQVELFKNYTDDESDKFDDFRTSTKGLEVYATAINRF